MADQTNLSEVLKALKVSCDDNAYGFVSVKNTQFKFEEGIIGIFQEKEGVTIIATNEYLAKNDLKPEALFAKMTVEVETSLQLVGLTAILATKLAENNISANVIAGYFHDYIFVQYEARQKAIDVLNSLKEG
jgi:uncharacterized protein